ncbi:MAG: hypothetical protein IT292_08675 [Deltaproteobacteria bacterium]|nr:hypothetical protein [Deltaproteobacteria bacterium]
MTRLRNKLIAFFTFIGGLYFFLEYILPAHIGGLEFGKYHEQISLAVQLIGLMAIGLGLINIFRVHGVRILKLQGGWFNSFVLLLGLAFVLVLQLLDFRRSEQRSDLLLEVKNFSLFVNRVVLEYEQKQIDYRPRLDALIDRLGVLKTQVKNSSSLLATGKQLDSERTEAQFVRSAEGAASATEQLKGALWQNNYRETKKITLDQLALLQSVTQELLDLNYEASPARRWGNFVFNGFFTPLGSAMFSLLAFYIVSAAYRSFRFRSWEAVVLMIPALIVMLGQIPHGPLYVYSGLPEIRRWLLEYLNTPAFRAIFFGSAIAGLAMSIRIWLSLEKSPLNTEETKQ